MKPTQEQAIKLLNKDPGGNRVAFYRSFFNVTKRLTSTLLLSTLFQMSTLKLPGSPSTNGWYRGTLADLGQESCLSRGRAVRAMAHLRSLKLVHVAKKGVPSKAYYRLDMVRLLELSEWAVRARRSR